MTIFQLITNPDYNHKVILDKLLRHHLQTDQAGLITRYDDELDPELIKTISQQYHAYTQLKQPLEYVLGYVEFFGEKFIVTPDTLIPRPETEYMILAVDEHISALSTLSPTSTTSPTILIDVGTGCGVLGLSTLLRHPIAFAKAYLTDISAPALEIAQKNADTHHDRLGQTSLSFLYSSLLDGLSDGSITRSPSDQIIIIANLPYIPEGTFDSDVEDSVKNREPKMAFVGGTDGNDRYRKMFNQLLALSTRPQATMFLEMMTRQLDILRAEYGETITFEICHTFHFNIIIVKAKLK